MDSRLTFRSRRQRHGAALVLMVFMLPVVLAIAAFVINSVYMELARTELQISTDVATRAAGRMLAITGDQQEAIDAANQLLQLNPYANTDLTIDDTDIVFGASARDETTEKYLFTPQEDQINAVSLRSFGMNDVPMIFPTFGVPIEFRPIKQAICTQIELDVAIVLDRSGSMAFSSSESSAPGTPAGWNFGQPVPANSRWLEAVSAVNEFISIMDASIHDEHLSLVTYSTKAKKDADLTNVYSTIVAEMNDHSKKFDGGATSIGDGLLEGGKTLSDKKSARPWASRVLILLSDGINNGGTDPELVAQQLANDKVMIYTVSYSDEADITVLKSIAQLGNGYHFHATDSAQLAEVFREIARSLPTLITF